VKHDVHKALRDRQLGLGDLDRVSSLGRDHVHDHDQASRPRSTKSLIPVPVVKVYSNTSLRIKRAVGIDDTSEAVCVCFSIVAA
jgi:hypothetical protein